MDVNEIKSVKPVEVAQASSLATRKPASELSADTVNASRSESVRVDITEKPERTERTNKARENANKLISALNVVSNVTEELDKIVTSLSGLADQAADPELPDSRRQILENEAQDLLNAIDERSQIQVDPPGVRPLRGDPLELEVEEELGKALKIILPETDKERLGLGQLTVSKVDRILATRRAIDEARDRIEELRSAVDNTKGSVQDVLSKADIAAQNREAAETQIRDVDEALKLTGGIQSLVSEDPDLAINAAAIQGASIRLLGSD